MNYDTGRSSAKPPFDRETPLPAPPLLPACATALVALVALCAPPRPALAAERDPARVEAARLVERAAARGDVAGGAVDLLRLAELADWLPDGEAEGALRIAALDARRAPLVRAVAWWLVRESALARLDRRTADEAVAALGLLDGFSMRIGPGPHPVAELSPDDFRPYPRGAGAGVLWLDAWLRPDRETTATVVSRLVSADGGPAVLRFGYDDAITVWLNGDEVYASPATHPAWLDQAAVPVRLRAGDNRLVVEVRQRSGAWRLIARVTDAAGEPLPVESHPDPWGAVPEPAAAPDDAEPPPEPAHLWTALYAAADAEPPVAEDLRDLADYARVTGLPDPDQALPRVAVEGVWPTDPGPRSLRAWLRLLPDAEQARVRTAHPPQRPVPLSDHWSDLQLAVGDAWGHYYARRHGEARRRVAAILAHAPDFLPAIRLEAVIAQDLGLGNAAAERLARARARWPERPGLRAAHVTALQSAGRVVEAREILTRMVDDGGGPDAHYQLAALLAARGETAEAVALLDAVRAARPELWTYGLEAAEMLWAAGEADAAVERLDGLVDERPGDPTAVERLARVRLARGEPGAAQAAVARALEVDPGADTLLALQARLTAAPARDRLGPPLEALLAAPPDPGGGGDAAAEVLYHHARAEVSADGRASRRVRRVIRVRTDEGARRYGTIELAYVPSTQRVELEQARLLRDDSPPISPRRSDRDLSDPAWRLYYDLRAEVLTFPKVQPGDVIEVAWRLLDTDHDPAFPGDYGELAWLQEAAPRRHTIVEIAGELAPALTIALIDRGLPVEREPLPGGGARFTAREVPGLPLEPGMPGPSSLRAHVHASSAPDWAHVDRRFRALLDARDAPALAEQARAWAGDAAATDPVDVEAVMARLHAAVADKIRYVGLEFGVHSFKPEEPAVTLARAFGDCKDKATLLIALAGALGVEARLALVRTRRSGAVEPHPASLAVFDHAVVYVPALDRFLDPTVDRNDPWNLPPSDQGATAFVIGDGRGPVTIPPQPAAHNRSDWRLDLALAPDGSATGEARWTTRGQPATEARRALDGAVDRGETLQGLLGERFPGARLEPPTVEGIAPAFDPVIARAAVALPPLHAIPGGFDAPLGGAPWQLVSRMAQAAERETALWLEYRHTHRLAFSLALPPEFTANVPPPVELASDFGRFTARATVAEQVVTVEVELAIEAFEVAPADYPAFRAWLAEVDHALAATVEVRR